MLAGYVRRVLLGVKVIILLEPVNVIVLLIAI